MFSYGKIANKTKNVLYMLLDDPLLFYACMTLTIAAVVIVVLCKASLYMSIDFLA